MVLEKLAEVRRRKARVDQLYAERSQLVYSAKQLLGLWSEERP